MRPLFSRPVVLLSTFFGLGWAFSSGTAMADDCGSDWHHETHSFEQGGWLSMDYQLGGPYCSFAMRNIWINAGGPRLSPEHVLDAELLCEWRDAAGRSAEPSTHPLALLYDARSQTFTAPLGELPIVREGRTGARANRVCAIQLFVNGNQVLRTDFLRFDR